MSEEKKKISLWQRLQFKYRISVLNEQTLAEKMYIRLNGIGAIVVVAVLFLLTMGLFSLVILYTPVKNYLPGYSEDIRQNLMKESARLDSIGTSLELQRQYLTVIKQVVAGELPPGMEDLFCSFSNRLKLLSSAERRILRYYVAGHEIAEIPDLDYISIHTVKKHNRSIYQKLEIASRDELMLYIELFRCCDRLDELTGE